MGQREWQLPDGVDMGDWAPEGVLPIVMRRLCIFRHRCYLCHQDHESQ